MKRGPRNMQMSREAMPPIRISPSIRPTASTRSRPDRARPLDQHRGRPAAASSSSSAAGLLGRRHRVRLAVEPSA